MPWRLWPIKSKLTNFVGDGFPPWVISLVEAEVVIDGLCATYMSTPTVPDPWQKAEEVEKVVATDALK